jgi:hypothetical protein
MPAVSMPAVAAFGDFRRDGAPLSAAISVILSNRAFGPFSIVGRTLVTL